MKKHLLLENIIYTIIWIAVFFLPILGFKTTDGIKWAGVYLYWGSLLPFFFIFIVNNFVLIPYFLLVKKYLLFIVTALLLIISTFSISSYLKSAPAEPQFNGLGQKAKKEMVHRPRRNMNLREQMMELKWKSIFNFYIVSILLVGFNISIRFIFKSIEDSKQLTLLEKEKLKSELNYLKAQINPHFFMNTLNNIHALIDIDQEVAKESIIELSKIMRYVLYDGEKNRVSLGEEVEFLKNYISLMKIRYCADVKIEENYPAAVNNISVPPLLFIVLLENAFKHGISYREGSYVISNMEIDGNYIVYSVKNIIPDKPVQTIKGGVGINNLIKRLDLLFGDKYCYNVNNVDGKYCAELKIPII